MGKRGKAFLTKVEKLGDNEKEKSKPGEKTKRNSILKRGSSSSESDSDIKLKTSKVVIDYKCKLLAEEALRKASGEQTPETPKKKKDNPTNKAVSTVTSTKPIQKTPVKASSPKPEENSIIPRLRASTRRSCNKETTISPDKKSSPSKPEKTSSPTARRRRKALTRALRSLRQPTRPIKKKRIVQKTRISLRSSSSSPTKRTLRTRQSLVVAPEKVKTPSPPPRRTPSKRIASKMDFNSKEGKERNSSPSAESTNISTSSPEESDEPMNPDFESDSDDNLEMHVLEKQVESEKEDSPRSFRSFRDTDEDDGLLSPSALPAPNKRKKCKSLSENISVKSKKEEFSSTLQTSTHTYPSFRTPSMKNTPYISHSTTMSSSSGSSRASSLGPLPGKRGRGRPRKALEDIKSPSGKLYRKKLTERLTTVPSSLESRGQSIYDYDMSESHHDEIRPFSSSQNAYSASNEFELEPSLLQMDDYYSNVMAHPETGDVEDPENDQQRLHRWKDRSTFVYARHKFVSNENKFRCHTCQVSFTALSSLKRHYGTIYHKQQEAAGGSTLDLSDILRPDRDADPLEELDLPGPSNFHSGGRGRGRGRPPLARTTSFVSRNAAASIKKYYAAADRRRRENYTSATATSSRGATGFTSTWIQKKQRKRKPLVHSDYLYTSASPNSEIDDADDDDDEDDFGCENEENHENDLGGNGSRHRDDNIDHYDRPPETQWLSNVWKGIGPPHFTCEVCHERFSRKFEFTKHLFQHRQDEAHRLSLTCPECHSVFPSEPLLQHHFNFFNHGIGVVLKDEKAAKEVQKLTCGKCNSKFARRDYFRKHLEVHKRPLMTCPHCPKKFLYKFYLNDHIKAKHDGIGNKNNAENAVNNNGVATVGTQPPGTGATPAVTNSGSTNPSGTLVNNIPRPKVELYSSTTTLFPSSDISKRKNSSVSVASNETPPSSSEDGDDDKRKNKSASAAVGIPVPTFTTCDPFAEEVDPPLQKPGDGSEEHGEKNSEGLSEEVDTPIVAAAVSAVEVPTKESKLLLQQYFDSPKKERTQQEAQREKINVTKSSSSDVGKKYFSSTATGVRKVDHSTTEDGKIVFQLEHSMFKGFTSMEGVEGDENACNMSPLTIEIPRDNINVDAEEGEDENEVEETEESGDNRKEDESIVKGGSLTRSPKITSPVTEPGEKIVSRQSSTVTNSSSGTGSSGLPLLGCGVKVNLIEKLLPDSELQCQDCGKLFEHRKSLIKHVRYYSQNESYPCTMCDKSFRLKHHVSRHLKSFHNVDTSSTTSSTSDETHLDDYGDTDSSLSQSTTTTPPKGSTTFSSSLTFPATSIPTSGHSPVSSRKDYSSVSSSPAKRSLSTDKLASVASTSQKERKGSASDASKKKEESDASSSSTSSSFSKSNYTTVVESSGATVFKCLICKKLYPSKHQISSHLSYHKRTIYPFKCSVCNADFKLQQELSDHQQVHHNTGKTTSTSFTCDKCPNKSKTFLTKKDLLKHEREKHHHLGRKPLASDHQSPGTQTNAIRRCPFCPLVFPQESDMQVHIRLEHNRRNGFACRICGQNLGTAELLKEHMLQRHEDEDYEDMVRGDLDEYDLQPPTPSPHNSPYHIPQGRKPEENEELMEEDTEPSSPVESDPDELLDLGPYSL